MAGTTTHRHPAAGDDVRIDKSVTIKVDNDYDATHKLGNIVIFSPASVTFNFDHDNAIMSVTNKITLCITGTRSVALTDVGAFALQLGASVLGYASSGLPGPKGNLETFVWLAQGTRTGLDDLSAAAAEVER